MYQEHGALFPFASTFDVTRRDHPDSADQVAAWLDASYERGASQDLEGRGPRDQDTQRGVHHALGASDRSLEGGSSSKGSIERVS